MTAVQGALLNPPATPPQQALLALPDVPDSYFDDNRREVWNRMKALAQSVRAAGFDVPSPTGGFYLWIDVRDRLEGMTTIEWCVRLAAEKGIGIWPGDDYGVPGHVRLALPQGANWRNTVAELERRLKQID